MGYTSKINKVMRAVNTATKVSKQLSKANVSQKINKARGLVANRKTRRRAGRLAATGATVAGLAVAGKRLGVKGSVLAGIAGYGAHKMLAKASPAYAAKAARKATAVKRLARATSKGISFNKNGPMHYVAQAAKTSVGQSLVKQARQRAAQWKGMSRGKKIATAALGGIAAYGAYKVGKKIVNKTTKSLRTQQGRQKLAQLAGRSVKRSLPRPASLLGPIGELGVKLARKRRLRRY